MTEKCRLCRHDLDAEEDEDMPVYGRRFGICTVCAETIAMDYRAEIERQMKAGVGVFDEVVVPFRRRP